MAELAGQFDFQSMIRAVRPEDEDGGSAIDVPLHKVAADAAIRSQGAFEIHNAVAAEEPQVCAVESFCQQIKSELTATERSDGKATTVDGQAVAFVNFLGNPRCGNLELGSAIRRPNPENGAEVFD